MGLYGTEDHHYFLRARTTLEIMNNRSLYDVDSPQFILPDGPSLTNSFRDVLRTAMTDGKYAELIHLFALSAALNITVQSYCCADEVNIRDDGLHPYTVSICNNKFSHSMSSAQLAIMWTKTRMNLSEPNHLVLLAPRRQMTQQTSSVTDRTPTAAVLEPSSYSSVASGLHTAATSDPASLVTGRSTNAAKSKSSSSVTDRSHTVATSEPVLSDPPSSATDQSNATVESRPASSATGRSTTVVTLDPSSSASGLPHSVVMSKPSASGAVNNDSPLNINVIEGVKVSSKRKRQTSVPSVIENSSVPPPLASASDGSSNKIDVHLAHKRRRRVNISELQSMTLTSQSDSVTIVPLPVAESSRNETNAATDSGNNTHNKLI